MKKLDDSKIVYVVDDDPGIRDSLSIYLHSLNLGLDLELFSSANQFIDYISDIELAASSCLIVDERMPGVSGIKLVEFLRKRAINNPIIMISGDVSETLKLQIGEYCGLELLEKPFHPELLKKLIFELFDFPNLADVS